MINNTNLLLLIARPNPLHKSFENDYLMIRKKYYSQNSVLQTTVN